MSMALDVVMDNTIVYANGLDDGVGDIRVQCRWCHRVESAGSAMPALRDVFRAARHECPGDPTIRGQLLAMLDGAPDRPQRPFDVMAQEVPR